MRCLSFICLIVLFATLLQLAPSASAQPGQVNTGAEARTSSDDRLEALAREVADLKKQSPQFTVFSISGTATVLAALIAFLATFVGAILALIGNFLIGRAQRNQERELAREKHTVDLVRDLGGSNLPLRIGAMTLLFDRIANVAKEPKRSRRERLIREQGRLLQAIISIAKEATIDRDLAKMIGDEVVKLLNAQFRAGLHPSARSVSPLHTFRGERLDFQKVRFPDVYWYRVDGRGIDFYGADFTKAGLREAFLHKTVFYGACLKECVLRDADLSEANLQEANLEGADLRGADLKGANLAKANLTRANLKNARADERTVWPEGFDAQAAL